MDVQQGFPFRQTARAQAILSLNSDAFSVQVLPFAKYGTASARLTNQTRTGHCVGANRACDLARATLLLRGSRYQILPRLGRLKLF